LENLRIHNICEDNSECWKVVSHWHIITTTTTAAATQQEIYIVWIIIVTCSLKL